MYTKTNEVHMFILSFSIKFYVRSKLYVILWGCRQYSVIGEEQKNQAPSSVTLAGKNEIFLSS